MSVEGARKLIEKVRGLAPIRGYAQSTRRRYRRIGGGDRGLIVAGDDSGLAHRRSGLNPLLVGREGQGAAAVDALIIRQD